LKTLSVRRGGNRRYGWVSKTKKAVLAERRTIVRTWYINLTMQVIVAFPSTANRRVSSLTPAASMLITGESYQNDDFVIDAPEFMADAIDSIVVFNTEWKSDNP